MSRLPPLSTAETRSAAVGALAETFARTAAERDRLGGTAQAERDLLRASGLLTLAIPEALGGQGAPWPEILGHVRRFAAVDGSLAHLFGFQHLLLATVALFGSEAQQESFFRRTVEGRWFWGNALNPLDPGTLASATEGGRRINGRKSFSSGSVDADALVVSASDEAHGGKLLVGVLPLAERRDGVRVLADWDAFGQRQTDSGAVLFENVLLRDDEILRTPGPLGDIRATLRPLLAQSILVHVYLGLAEGAFAEALPLASAATRPWLASGVERPQDDPYLLARHGEIALALRSAALLAEAAARSLRHTWEKGENLTEAERGEAALDIAAAKIATTRAALDIPSKIFDLVGAKAAVHAARLDRFWRNARLHTLHDPIDYKVRELGVHALLGTHPKPTFYS
ncbi:Acyl-CoA dehydrogenase [Verrucomicrobium sp. GAS474]|uniref:acyl-CoA dehydrogenase family protein n=1 Tax=Verrucomicrobium sp. GAS474 TaxID=1882831 RepID=UPI00087ADF26|nr:acyl-CoA dehydrogenase family protein [Verrucomicrobium sp. GAS474]SDT97180.1 Acyl-CoA dehydrogenase [Verrucomicrobium sp. GAS474]